MALGLVRRGRSFAEINVTPLADVIIVLLVICMVTVPRLSGPVRTLPAAGEARERQGSIEVAITTDGTVWLGARPLAAVPELAPRLRETLTQRPSSQTLIVKAEAALPYATVQEVLRQCRDAGVEELVLATRARTPF